MKLKFLISLFFAVLISQPVYAIKVSGLYQATAPVADESTSNRKSATKLALIDVLIKLTGDRYIGKSSEINALIEQPDRFVQQFRYQKVINEEEPVSESTTELWVQFDETTLNDALRSYGLNIWGKERPSILVWLAYEKNDARRLVSFEENPAYITMLDKAASKRGVSLLFPLLDLEDTSRMKVSDVWGNFKEPIINASQRYQADVVLTGRISQSLPTLWESRWSYYLGNQEMNWTTQGDLDQIVLEEGLNGLVDRLASQYVDTGSTNKEVIKLVISDINDLNGYAKTLNYLESIQAISDVQVRQVSAGEVTFEVISYGGIDKINQTIALGKTLELVEYSEQINYRLIER